MQKWNAVLGLTVLGGLAMQGVAAPAHAEKRKTIYFEQFASIPYKPAGAGSSLTDAELRAQEESYYLTPASIQIEQVVEEDSLGALARVRTSSPAPSQSDPVDSGSDGDVQDNPGLSGTGLDEATVVVDQIINIGRKIWAVVDANRPVFQVNTESASAVPAGITHWAQLQGWKSPESKLFRVTYRNLLGMKVVDYTYRLLYTPGGNWKGKGAYLSHVTVVPADIMVGFAYTFRSDITVPNVVNAGSTAAPIGAAEVLVGWSVDTALKHHQASTSFFIKGDGSFQDLSQGSSVK